MSRVAGQDNRGDIKAHGCFRLVIRGHARDRSRFFMPQAYHG